MITWVPKEEEAGTASPELKLDSSFERLAASEEVSSVVAWGPSSGITGAEQDPEAAQRGPLSGGEGCDGFIGE